MKFVFARTVFAFWLSVFCFSCASPQKKICPAHVDFKDPSLIDFNENEEIFLCGDSKNESWREIPPAQAEFTLKNFLKQRAYYHPTFQFGNGTLTVDPGVQSRATSLSFEGAPPEFDQIKLRNIIGKPLTSTLLDTVEGFALIRLKTLGYACPEVKIQAVIETGTIVVQVKSGPPYRFLEPKIEDSLGLYPKTMRRFDAFALDAPFESEFIQLSTNRAENDGIVVSSQFAFTCPNPQLGNASSPEVGVAMNQKLIGGDKQLVTLGAGISTEEFPIAQATWKTVRMSDTGTNLMISLYGSSRKQTFQTTLTEYIFKNAPRFDVSPKLSYNRSVESTYTSNEIQLATPLEYRGDAESHSWFVSLGPSISRVFSQEAPPVVQQTLGLNTDITGNFFSWIGRTTFMSHLYELYQNDPQTGYLIDFNTEILYQQVLGMPLATILKLNGTELLKLNPVSPTQWVLGFRYGLATTVSREAPQTTTQLPAQYFNTLGGDQSLRGFGRNELTQGTVGARTSIFGGTEFRYAKTFALGPVGIEPFVFFDLGSLGNEQFSLDSTVYYSPGFGSRLATPFGAIRTTIAHGYYWGAADPSLSHIQFFISFGREF